MYPVPARHATTGPSMCALGLMLCVAGAAWAQPASAPAGGQSPSRRVNVWVDLSREYSLAWASLAKTLDAARYHVTLSYAPASPEALAGQDIAVVYYNQLDTTWIAPMAEAVKQLVRRGGGALILGHGGHWAAPHGSSPGTRNYQVNRLAKPFGFWFEVDGPKTTVPGPLRFTQDGPTAALTTYVPGEPPGVLTDLTGAATPLLVGQDGGYVMACRPYGLGKVCASSDPAGLVPGGPNQALLAALLAWLTPSPLPPVSTPVPDALVPQPTWEYQGVGVAVPPELTPQSLVRDFQVAAEAVAEETQHLLGARCTGHRVVVNLPPGSPAPGARVGLVPSYGADAQNVFPLTDACARAFALGCAGDGRLPGAFDDAWSVLFSSRVLTKLKYPGALQTKDRMAAALAALPADEARRLDLVDLPADPRARDAATAKAVGLLEELERRYGADLWSRFIDQKGNRTPPQPDLDAEAFARLLEAAGAGAVREVLATAGIQVPASTVPRTPGAGG